MTGNTTAKSSEECIGRRAISGRGGLDTDALKEYAFERLSNYRAE